MSAGITRRTLPMSVRRRQTRDFLQYLNTNNLKESINCRDDMKNVFDLQYKQYKSDTDPEEVLAYFGALWHLMVVDKRIHVMSGGALEFTSRSSEQSLSALEKRHKDVTVTSQPTSQAASSRAGSGQGGRRGKQKARLAVDQHLTGVDKVLQELRSKDDPANNNNDSLPSGTYREGFKYHCRVCRIHCSSRSELEKHLVGKKHRVQTFIRALRTNKDDLIKDKNDIVVSSEHDVPGSPGLMRVDMQEQEARHMEIRIENRGASVLVFRHCEMLKRIRVFTLDDAAKVTEGLKTFAIYPGEDYRVRIAVKARHLGRYNTPLAMMFTRGEDPSCKIHIIRTLLARCNNALIQSLQPSSPFRHPPRRALNRDTVDIIDGIKPNFDMNYNLEYDIPLAMHNVPRQVRQAMNRGLKATANMSGEDAREQERIRDHLSTKLNYRNHHRKFELLLHIEEIQMEVDILKYSMDDAVLTRSKDRPKLLSLRVPGLAENRPSVLKNDHLFVRIKTADGKLEGPEYKGYVHDIHVDKVLLGFSAKLMDKFVEGMKFSVRFSFNRLPLRLQHRSVQLSDELSLDKLLFPEPDTVCKVGIIQPINAPIRLYDRQLETNREQLSAVRHILAGTSRPAPYLLFGPPGTGKTVTVVETIKQVLKCIPKSCILACAPSNSAADLLVERLLKHVDNKDVFRLYAASRAYHTIPAAIKEVCNYDRAERRFYYPPKNDLQKYRILVTTLITAGRLASANFPSGHFTHVFIDEAGHAVECEALIAIAGIIEANAEHRDGGQVVLAGDPEQLGPVLRSPVAIKGGLSVSLLERYMKQVAVYQRRTDAGSLEEAYDRRLLTKLVRNYRSHPDILKLPNEMFYSGELEAHADQLVRESMCQWEGLPKKRFPVVFHSVIGEDMREERSPSFFNPEEVAIVVDYVDKLLMARGHGIKVTEKDIGIISPYRKQVQKIRQTLQKKKHDIKVGSVEEFQGQESKVIIISTVRSKAEYLAMDAEFKLGFLRNPKRFNVAVTRAKALLIVVGNPLVLSKDYHWGRFIEYCQKRGGFLGAEFDMEDPDEQDDIIQRFSAVKLDDIVTPDSDEGPASNLEELQISAVEHVEQPEWRGDD